LRTQSPCDASQLGSQSDAYIAGFPGRDSNISSSYELGGNTLWQKIKKLVDVSSIVNNILNDEENLLTKVLSKDDNSLTNMQRDLIEAMLPLVTVCIYLPPCASLIHTAIKVWCRMKSSFVKVVIRPDDRLSSSCCTASDRIQGLKSILDYVRDWEAKLASGTSQFVDSLDRAWLEQRLDHLEYEQPYEYQEYRDSHAIILGELDHLVQLLQKAPGRIPKATEIWDLGTIFNTPLSYTRRLFGSFTERKWPDEAVVRQPVAPKNLPPQLEREGTRPKRLSSSVSTDAKRQKPSAILADEDTESVSSGNSVANSLTEYEPHHELGAMHAG
jgi:hypothetical protein